MINASEFGNFCDSFIEKFQNDDSINFYDFSPTLHKVLWHGKEAIEFFPLPIGWMTEEVSFNTHMTQFNVFIFRDFGMFHTSEIRGLCLMKCSNEILIFLEYGNSCNQIVNKKK